MLIRSLLGVPDRALGERLGRTLAGLGAEVVVAGDGRFWAERGDEGFDLVVTSRAGLPEPLEISIAEIRNLGSRPDVIVFSDANDLELRARLLAAGALAVVAQSLPEPALRETLGTLLDRHRKAEDRQVRASRELQIPKLSGFASKSRPMQELLELAGKVAAADTSLLVLGETGVGKEWLARGIHAESPRADGPFIAVNPAALPEQLLESELFGHEKGAFTGATKARRGAFELAHGGTLFLDEIGDMPPHLQIKLLRVLQELRIQRLGSERQAAVDVRVMAATNQDLERAMEEKRFRQDLYYRLSVMPLTVPPLRQRVEDIPLLVETHVDRFRTRLGRLDIQGTSLEAMRALEAYHWPGNVRELINVVERAVLLCEGALITLEELPEDVAGGPTGDAGSASLGLSGTEEWYEKPLSEAREGLVAAFERDYLSRLLEETRGNVGAAARRAAIDPRTLYNKMKLYGLRKEDFRADRGG